MSESHNGKSVDNVTPKSNRRHLAHQFSGSDPVSRSTDRRYSQVVSEYLRLHKSDSKNSSIPPSKILNHNADHAAPHEASYVSWECPDTPSCQRTLRTDGPKEEATPESFDAYLSSIEGLIANPTPFQSENSDTQYSFATARSQTPSPVEPVEKFVTPYPASPSDFSTFRLSPSLSASKKGRVRTSISDIPVRGESNPSFGSAEFPQVVCNVFGSSRSLTTTKLFCEEWQNPPSVMSAKTLPLESLSQGSTKVDQAPAIRVTSVGGSAMSLHQPESGQRKLRNSVVPFSPAIVQQRNHEVPNHTQDVSRTFPGATLKPHDDENDKPIRKKKGRSYSGDSYCTPDKPQELDPCVLNFDSASGISTGGGRVSYISAQSSDMTYPPDEISVGTYVVNTSDDSRIPMHDEWPGRRRAYNRYQKSLVWQEKLGWCLVISGMLLLIACAIAALAIEIPAHFVIEEEIDSKAYEERFKQDMDGL